MIPGRALVLSAGRGLRLRPYTDDRPKTMMELGGRPLLEYHVVLLREHGIREIAVNLHHRPGVVIEHFGDGSRWGVSIRYSIECELKGTAGAAKQLERFLGAGRFLVVYGDNLLADDFMPLFERHDRTGATATIAVHNGLDPHTGGIAAVDRDGRVTCFVEKPRPGEVVSKLVNAGLYVMEPEVLDFIPGDRASDFGSDTLPALLLAGRHVCAWTMKGYVSGIDTPERYRRTQLDVDAGRVPHPLAGSR